MTFDFSSIDLTSIDLNKPLEFTHGQLAGSSDALLIAHLAKHAHAPVIAVVNDTPHSNRLLEEIRFFEPTLTVCQLPDWETLPYDQFSPHQDIISERLLTLYQLPGMQSGVLLVPISTLIQRLPPRTYLDQHALIINKQENLSPQTLRDRLTAAGYRHTEQVLEHGEFALRGSILDLFPMGSEQPYRIDFFDDEIDSLRTFDVDTQRSLETIDSIQLLPAHEFPMDDKGITSFRQNWRAQFDTSNKNSLYHQVSNGESPAGIEYYLPLFHDTLDTLFDYLPNNVVCYLDYKLHEKANQYWDEIVHRYEQYRHQVDRPLLEPKRLFITTEDLFAEFKAHPRVAIKDLKKQPLIASQEVAEVKVNHRKDEPLAQLKSLLSQTTDKVLIAAESAGRREAIVELFRRHQIPATLIDSWHQVSSIDQVAICIAPLVDGFRLKAEQITVITENQLFGFQQRVRHDKQQRVIDPDAIIRNLAELNVGDPIVHAEQGVGRYLGLQTLESGNITSEFLTIEYDGGDKLYVPVNLLHLVSRYTGSSDEHAPLHKLGTEQWQKARSKAAKRARDVAAELLDIHAKRQATPGTVYQWDELEYQQFVDTFPYQTTPDQQKAIDAVLADLKKPQAMDRLVCGDVGFGKTEVAMRAAFIVSQSSRQVTILVPTTLLAQQHFESFSDRFADWPVKVALLSRFRTAKEQKQTLEEVASGKVDILIGTHKLLQKSVKYKDLGLLIIDEEHRFGVNQKEQIKAFRAEVDILTLTATPIPRTLNMSLSGMRDLSIIASPPARRLAIKTFVREHNKPLIREAVLREIMRGGQVYFLHNDVASIERIAGELAELVPEAKVAIGHGQMAEKQLERVMSDFYHQRFNLLVCSTIIETGIDVPTANTIIIHRADKLGLAQLHQLRGRVGRSHHQAYAYMLTPPSKLMTKDAQKRLEAIENLGDLGSGFILATQDMEIRGAGELLGDEQSGQIQTIGFSLYMEMLEEAVLALKEGREPSLVQSLAKHAEVELKISALIPEDYIADVAMRLAFYKRIANAKDIEQLDKIQVELIDRFGLLPDVCKQLFRVSELKLAANRLGIARIKANDQSALIEFKENAPLDPLSLIEILQSGEFGARMSGSTKLQIETEMEQPQTRITVIEQLLSKLRLNDAQSN